jgi:hypothetical protein
VKLDFLLLADQAGVDNAGKINIKGGGVTHVRAPTLPFDLPALTLVIRFFLEEGDETPPQRELEVRVRLPDGEPIGVVAGKLRFRERGDDLSGFPGEPLTLVVISKVEGLVLPVEGIYIFEVFLDGERLDERQVAVVLNEEREGDREAKGT